MKPRCWLALAVVCVASSLASATSTTDRTPASVDKLPRARVEHDGEVFELAATSRSGNVSTDEYVTSGETIGSWTQLVTVQRMSLAAAVPMADFLTYFRTRIVEDGATFELVTQSASAGVFAVRFPPSERNEEQVMVCVAFADRSSPSTINIVQFAIKPRRGDVTATATRIKSWRDKFLLQARAAGERSSSAVSEPAQ